MRQILTEQDITEVVAAYRSGATAKALAERYGVHTSTIKMIRSLSRAGHRHFPQVSTMITESDVTTR